MKVNTISDSGAIHCQAFHVVRGGAWKMGDEATDRLKLLCDKIANENDPEKLAALARELDRWLADDEARRKKMNDSAEGA